MKKELIKIIKELKGNLLGIGVDSSLEEAISKNDNILECNLLTDNVKTKEKGKGKTKKIKIRKLKKYFKKKSIDTIICNYEVIKNYKNSIIRSSIYLNKGFTYIYGNIDDIDEIIRKYKRYNVKIDIKNYKDNYIVIIDNELSKWNYLKNICYQIVDFFDSILIIIGDVLMG